MPRRYAPILKIFIPLALVSVSVVIGYKSFQNHPGNRELPASPGIGNAAGKDDPFPGTAAVQKARIQDPDLEAAGDPAAEAESPSGPVQASGESTQGDNLYLRVQDVVNLRNDPSKESVEQLLQFLEDESGTVVSEAVDTLGAIALKNRELRDMVLRILKEKAGTKDFPQRGHALITAATVGKEEVLPLISDYISDRGEGAVRFAARALSLIGSPDSVPLLQDLLNKAEEVETRNNCLSTLGRIGTSQAVQLIEKHVVSTRGADQAAGVAVLSRLNKPESNRLLQELILNDRLGEQAMLSVSMSTAAPEIFSGLLAKGDMDAERKRSLLKLVQEGALYATGETRSRLVTTLAPFLDSPDEKVQVEAIKTISLIGGGEKETPDLLIPKLQSSDAQIRREALTAFVGYANPWNYQALLDLVFDDDKKTRRMALFAAERFVSEADRTVLERAANSEDEVIREHSQKLLEQLQSG